MRPPLRLDDVLTARSKTDYHALAAHHPELPPTLEELLATLDKPKTGEVQAADRCVRILLAHMQDPDAGGPSVQLWLLWIFRRALAAMAGRYQQPGRPYDEVIHDATWCLLEAMHRANPATAYIIRNIARDARKLLRRNYGMEYGPDTPQQVQVEEMMETGWDVQAPATASYIQELQLPAEDQYLLVGQYIYGFSQEEIAEQLGIRPEALRQRMRRLLARLRKGEK